MKNTTTLTLGAALLLSLSACSSIQRNTVRVSPGDTYATGGKGEEVLPPVAERTTTNQRWGQRFSAF